MFFYLMYAVLVLFIGSTLVGSFLGSQTLVLLDSLFVHGRLLFLLSFYFDS